MEEGLAPTVFEEGKNPRINRLLKVPSRLTAIPVCKVHERYVKTGLAAIPSGPAGSSEKFFVADLAAIGSPTRLH